MASFRPLLHLAITYILCFPCLSIKNHVVGNSIWSIPLTSNFYSEWSDNTTFTIGDTLLFKFGTGFYDVVQVSRREYVSCTAENPFNTYQIGPVTVALGEEGMRYYLCSFGNYCSLGMKLAVSVQPPPELHK